VVKLAGKLLKRAVAMVNQSVVRYAFKMVAGMVLLLGSVGCEFDVNVKVDSEESAAEFLTRVEQEMLELDKETGAAYWVRATHITADTGLLAAKAGERQLAFLSKIVEQAKRYKDTSMDAESARGIELILRGSAMPAPDDEELRAELSQIATDLEGLYGAGKYCDVDGKCSSLPELENVLSASRDYDEQLQAWLGWRTVSPPMRDKYQRFVELANAGAQEFGAANLGDMWKGGYDMDVAEFEAETERLWGQVEPLYEALHCHVRANLSDFYGAEKVADQGPIPAHLLGNMWAQTWSNLYPLIEPYPGVASLDVTAALDAQNYDAVRMTETAEAFFTSLGLPELPDSFWRNSMLTKPADRDVVCHASAWDLDNGNDPRIKQCVEVNEEQLATLHHELGHIYYYLMYKDQRPLFKGGAHDGFHEAIGDTIVLSMTPDYLRDKGLVDTVVVSDEATINEQMKLALDKIAFLPFGKLIDQWRWKVFAGEIKPEQYNQGWWALREQYQGIAAPVARSEANFDPGAKFHIPGNTPYTRYFLSHVMQFQFHKALCDAAGYTGPLHRCSIYGNEQAGDKLGQMLALGASQPWPEAMQALTGQREMDASAIIDYFAPLMAWLEEQNQGRQCGW
jgi:peptidyl-dipeptidase A